MEPIIIRDASILATDRAVPVAYREGILDLKSSSVIRDERLFSLNLGGASESPFRVLSGAESRFYCIAGSSNFHHLDVVNLKRLSDKLAAPLQLILVDQHMDCVRFEPETDFLHCGNWVSYAYGQGFVSKIAMIGCRDYRGLAQFDARPENDGNLAYFPDPAESRLEGFLDPARPVYLSVDTDVLSLPSDWNLGLHSLDVVLCAPFWDFLERAHWVGAFLHGHVTDNRRFLDACRALMGGQVPSVGKRFFRDLGMNLIHGLWPKFRASLTPRLPLKEQIAVMLALYARAERARAGGSGGMAERPREPGLP